MTAATLEKDGAGRFQLLGALSFDSVPALCARASQLFTELDSVQVDLQGVTRSDSAGVALLVEWMRVAREQERAIRFVNIPHQMLAIARVSSLDDILPLSRA